MSSDEKFEAFLEREAARLNEPPVDVPREEMWAAIAATRASRPIRVARPRHRMRSTPWIGMAATLVLGLGIGRYLIAREMGTVLAVDSLAVDSLAVVASRVIDARAAAQRPGADGITESPAMGIGTTIDPPVAASRVQAVRLSAAGRPAAGTSAPAADTFAQRNGGSATYSAASQQHLTRAEALVAVVSVMPADAALDSLTGRWAREILTNTRLLLDSPAGDDPMRRRLLEDLESVLVQLVQRSGRTAEDRAMIDRTLQKTQILTRLRSGATGT